MSSHILHFSVSFPRRSWGKGGKGFVYLHSVSILNHIKAQSTYSRLVMESQENLFSRNMNSKMTTSLFWWVHFGGNNLFNFPCYTIYITPYPTKASHLLPDVGSVFYPTVITFRYLLAEGVKCRLRINLRLKHHLKHQ